MLLGLAPALLAEIRLSRRRRPRRLWSISPAERREFFYAELLTSLPAAKEVRLFGLSALFRRRMLDRAGRSPTANAAGWTGGSSPSRSVSAALGRLVLGGGLVWAVRGRHGGRLTVGDVSTFVAAIAGVQAALRRWSAASRWSTTLLLMYRPLPRGARRAGRTCRAGRTRSRCRRCGAASSSRDVWFRYGQDQPWVLRGVDLVIPHGAAVALVGLNGAGKSTLVKLLCRFYDPDRGRDPLGRRRPARRCPLAELRRRIGACSRTT